MRKSITFDMRIIGAVLVVLLIASFAGAQQRWTKTYGGTSGAGGSSVQQTTDGGYIVAGYINGAVSDDVYLIKTNASGDTVWTKTYGGTGNDAGYFVQQTTDGGYIVVGYTLSFSASRDVYLIKTDSSGDTTWTKTYGGAGNDIAYSVQQTADLGYIVTGYTSSHGAGAQDVYLIKTNASGDTLWTRTYGGTGDDEGSSVRQTSDGGYIIAGLTSSFGAGTYYAYLIRTNASGDTLWTRTYGWGLAAEGSSVRQTSDGGYIVTGYTYPSAPTTYDVFLVKTNSVGDTLWTRAYGGAGADYGYSVRQTTDGGYIVAGTTRLSPNFDVNVYLIKTNASGDTLWTSKYGGGADDEGNSVQQTTDGGYIIAGFTNSFGPNYAVYLIKTDANGSIGVQEPGSGRKVAAGSIRTVPNPFVSFARVPGHEAEQFELYDISGKLVGTYRGDRVGEGLSPAVYFIKLDAEPGRSLRVVKVGPQGK
jgi:hypothetical protein